MINFGRQTLQSYFSDTESVFALQHTIPVLLPNSVVDGTVSEETLRCNSVHPHDRKSTGDQQEKKSYRE